MLEISEKASDHDHHTVAHNTPSPAFHDEKWGDEAPNAAPNLYDCG
jgi:hypothetical protein